MLGTSAKTVARPTANHAHGRQILGLEGAPLPPSPICGSLDPRCAPLVSDGDTDIARFSVFRQSSRKPSLKRSHQFNPACEYSPSTPRLTTGQLQFHTLSASSNSSSLSIALAHGRLHTLLGSHASSTWVIAARHMVVSSHVKRASEHVSTERGRVTLLTSLLLVDDFPSAG